MEAVSVPSPGSGSLSSAGGSTIGARAASLGSLPDCLLAVMPMASNTLPLSSTSPAEQPAKTTAQTADATTLARRAGRLSWSMILSPVVGRRRPGANPNHPGYNGFAAPLRLGTNESYRRPTTPATIATSAMLNTYQ